ncbi:MAG: HEAT repeat domain-containing protein [Planctomycetota bacterium]|jgi:hypothetical protein
MKIYFCDDCNESIPLQDIKDSKAATLKGKIYCRNCNPLKEVESQKVQYRSTRLTNSMLMVVGALLVVVICLMIFQGGQKEDLVTTSKMNQSLSQLDLRLQNHFEDMIGQKVIGLNETLEGQNEKISKLETELMEIRGDLLGLRAENENMSKNFQSVTNVRERLDELILKQDEFSTSLEEMSKRQARYGGEIKDLDTRFDGLAQTLKSGTFLSPGSGDSWDSEQGGESARVETLKQKLQSKDAGERFEAVYEVLDERVKEALPYVLPLIEDPDQFVQVGAIQTVGEFLYMDSLPTLVKVLRDADATVRDEALRQLIRMTGQNNLSFDVRGSESEKEKAIRKWEKWLKDRK